MTAITTAVRSFAYEHDELPAFHAAYLVLTVLAAALLNLGAFGLLIATHMVLDLVKYRGYHHCSWIATFKGMARESLVDLTLFFVALSFAIYFHHSIPGIAGLSGLRRAEITLVRGAGALFPKIRIFDDFLRMAFHVERYMASVHPRFGKALSGPERLYAMFFAVAVVLVLLAPVALGIGSDRFFGILGSELTPWKL